MKEHFFIRPLYRADDVAMPILERIYRKDRRSDDDRFVGRF